MERDVQIHPENSNPIRQILDQPEVKQVSTLPKLELPNILFQPPKSSRGIEAPVPIFESSEDLQQVKAVLSKVELPNQFLDQPKTSRGIEAPVALPELTAELQQDLGRDTLVPTGMKNDPKIPTGSDKMTASGKMKLSYWPTSTR